MTARKRPGSSPTGAGAALRGRIRELEAANRGLTSRVVAAERVRDAHGRQERQQVERELDRSRERLRALASELTLAEARERRRLASILHDEVGQGLALSRIKLGLLGHWLTTDTAQAAFAELRELFAGMSKRIRSLTFELSPPILYQLGLAAALEWLGEKLEKEHGLRCRVDCDRDSEPVDEAVSILLFQSVRELLANASKHARASAVLISITVAGGWVTLTVGDDGIGFDPQAVSQLAHRRDSFGLFSIGERMRYVNGSLEIDSAPGRGTRVTLSAPTVAIRQADSPDASCGDGSMGR
jgi:signal transduction histidine kinase